MAKLMKTFIGGIASKMSGSDPYDAEVDKQSRVRESPVDSKLSLSGSDDLDVPVVGSSYGEDEEVYESETISMKGSLSKWTNYLHGWQERYFVVGEGVLSYYKSEMDTQYGCRGSISLHKVKVLQHEFDDLRFDIRAHDCTYFLRACSLQEKMTWVEAIEMNQKHILESGFDANMIRRQGSILSLSGMSQASASSVKMGHDLQSKLAELETYRDILCRQVDLLQAYFDSLAESNASGSSNQQQPTVATPVSNGISASAESIDDIPEEGSSSSNHLAPNSSPVSRKFSDTRPSSSTTHHSPLPSRFTPKGHRRTGSDPFAFKSAALPGRGFARPHFNIGGSPFDVSNIDFRGEAITFKATTAGILASLSNCIEIMTKREEYWQKKFEKEQDRRHRAESAAQAAINGPRVRAYEYAGPDFEEGPHSALNEDEFFDALEMAYQNDEMENTRKAGDEDTRHGDIKPNVEVENEPVVNVLAGLPDEIVHQSASGITHKLTTLVNEKVSQYAQYVFEPLDDCSWNVVHEDGEMKVYRRELEEDGVVVDPLRASYCAPGISAREVSNFFFDKDTRMEWEGTLESVEVVESLAEDTVIFHQLHKRVWPSTQRETLFCSHLCTLSNAPRPENMIGRTWMVCNFSVEHESVPTTSKLIRATLHVGLVCQTITTKPVEAGKEAELSRDDIQCKIVYAANVNPGGWAPPSVVRTIGKRELCKFLKKFSGTAQSRSQSSPLTL